MTEGVFAVDGAFGGIAAAVVAAEFPDLPDDRRLETTAFTAARAGAVPAPLRIGLAALCTLVDAAMRRFGTARTVRWLGASRLPLVGELPRMIRSLATAYIWERWPATGASGAPA